MGFWRNAFGLPPATTTGIQSPHAPTDTLVTFAAEIMGQTDARNAVPDRAAALKIPGVKRGHGIHCVTVAGFPFYVMNDKVRATEQLKWLTNSSSGISPYHRMHGVTSDLFMDGWACIGITADDADALHIPNGMWGVNRATGEVTASDLIEAKYHAKLIVIPLGYGSNGILVDGADSLRAARLIDKAWIDRVENPIPATNLHITDPQYDQISKKAKQKIVDSWNENRRRDGGATAVTQSFIEVDALGTVSADLFEKGRNAVRLDLANHAGVPASIIEGSKDSGGNDVEYSNAADSRNELYDLGTKAYVLAIEARLSLDDVCAPGLSIRADLGNLMAPTSPNSNPTAAD
jgi:hypothetical protein